MLWSKFLRNCYRCKTDFLSKNLDILNAVGKLGSNFSFSIAFIVCLETPFTLKHLRKTYLTWVFHTMGSDTRLLSSHSSMKVLENHYINPLLLNVEEEKLMKIKVFG
jgi:hypothetical protein